MNIPIDPKVKEQHIYTLRNQVLPAIDKILPSTKPLWGSMTAQHMVEHLAQVVIFSSIVSTKPRSEPIGEQVGTLKALIYSDVEFPHNIMNPMYKEGGLPAYAFASIKLARNHVENGINIFFKSYNQSPQGYSFNPFMGDLDFDQLLVLHVKHFRHHLKQFGVAL